MHKLIKNKKGFTLAELLVAVIVALLIILIVSSVFLLNQRLIRKSNLKAELTQNARIILDLMAREIRQANEIVTILPADDSDPGLVAHEIKFEDGHTNTQIQYIRYYLDSTDFKRQIIAYYFNANCGGPCPPLDPSYYVYWDDVDGFGPPDQTVKEDKIIGENFSNINLFGTDNVNVELILTKKGEQVEMESIINPRNN